MSADDVSTSLHAFVARAFQQAGRDWFEAPYDSSWRSDCEIGEPEGELIRWRPTKQSTPVDFSGLSNALDTPIHEDICAYYGTFWSGSLESKSKEGHVSLIQLWNQEDFERLVENLVGHALAKRRAKQPFTVFFANTEIQSELFLSIDNESGKVLLEEPGRAPIKVVDDNVARFLDRLQPIDTTPGIY